MKVYCKEKLHEYGFNILPLHNEFTFIVNEKGVDKEIKNL